MNNCKFLPVCRADMEERGIEQLDFVYVIGDAYVDHPSFGHAIISRILEATRVYGGNHFPAGLERSRTALLILGEPQTWRFWFSAGNMDSMVNHYSVSKKRRQNRCLYTRRSDGKTTGLCDSCLLQPDPPDIQAYARLLSAGSRPAFVDWHIMITGRTD